MWGSIESSNIKTVSIFAGCRSINQFFQRKREHSSRSPHLSMETDVCSWGQRGGWRWAERSEVFSVSHDSCGQSEASPPAPCIKTKKEIYIWRNTKEELHLRMTASYSGDVHSHTFMQFYLKPQWFQRRLSHLYYYWGMLSHCNLSFNCLL